MKHAGILESTQEARVALGYSSSNSYVFFVLSKRMNQLLMILLILYDFCEGNKTLFGDSVN